MKWRSFALVLSILALTMSLWSTSKASGAPEFKVTGIYSDMRYVKESGDVIGDEIFIVYSKSGYFAVIQSSEGEPSKPAVVPVKVSGSSISFSVPAEVDPRGDFNGSIMGDHLIGTFSSNKQAIDLKRKSSYWQ